MRVLLVDDDEPAAAATCDWLEAIDGWEVSVHRVTTLAAAIEAVAEDSFDVALLELSLPDAEPHEPVTRLRDAARELPIVVLTSSIDCRRACDVAVRQGAEELLVKDACSPESLRRSIRHAIDRRASCLLLERSNRAFESVAHAVAHEIRSPLSTVSFACELLRRQELDDAGSRQLDRIRSAVTEVDGIIEGLLAYASATDPGPMEDVDLAKLVGEVSARLRVDDGVLRVEALPVVRGVRSRLRLLLHSLLCNALVYADSENPVIRVAAARSGRAWEVCVEDNGAGIPAEECERVFEPFRRGSGRKAAGSGLGLAICQRIVEERGGSIEAGPGSLGGCRVSFTLPDAHLQLDAPPLP